MSWGKNSFSCVALHQRPCLRVPSRLHDLILFDGCIISMYEDVQGKNSRLATIVNARPRVAVPG